MGLLILLIALVVFATALVGSLTGASVYYKTEQFQVYRNPSAANTRNLDAQTLSTNKLYTEGVYSQAGTPLTLASKNGIYLEKDTTLTVPYLAGIGNAYVCVDPTGRLYRSEVACT